METNIYNSKGKKGGALKLPESVFGLSWNGDLVHQVMHSILANTRAGTADTKENASGPLKGLEKTD